MAFNKRENRELDMEQVAAFLKDAVAKVESDPELYEELKKVFKKNVPLTRRSYVAAYLLKNSGGLIYRFNSNNKREEFRRNREENRRSNRVERDESTSESKETFPRVTIEPENAGVVFVGIGRNRRVYPRDLVGLFISVAGIKGERIGRIKVLANYSFVELFKEDTDKAIEALNGYEYRGRKLNVNISKNKVEEGAAETSIEEERVPNVENVSAPIVDSFTATNSDTVAQQAAFAKEMEKAPIEMTDEEILAMRAPRSSSTADIQ